MLLYARLLLLLLHANVTHTHKLAKRAQKVELSQMIKASPSLAYTMRLF